MPNTAKKKQGKALRKRVKDAAKLTAEQQQQRSSSGPSPASTDADKAKKGKKAKVTKRKATQELKHQEEKKESGAKGKRKGLNRIAMTRRLKRALIVVGVIVVLLAILYPVGRNYYSMLRQQQRLEAELAAVEERNSEIEGANDALATEEGVENQAREDLGWVPEGDSAAVVTNAPEDGEDEGKLPAQVDAEEVHAPKTWYYNILDTIFFVHE